MSEFTGYAAAIFGSGRRDAGAGHATLMPAQPPGRQGPSYPVGPGDCPQGYARNTHGQCVLVSIDPFNLGAGAGHIIPAQPPGKQGPSYPVAPYRLFPRGGTLGEVFCPTGTTAVQINGQWQCQSPSGQLFPPLT